ncbi:MAG: NAD-dependent epimerase/dehydratase family protein [Alphaproteobacteria bacterium]|nr:NAD-dependent epimerase/dehydratase family protein [Alphaproteobacteria bacterium]
MSVLVTGAAGFIGFHVSAALLARGERVIGVDNLNPYYSVALKRARLKRLAAHKRFAFHRLDLAQPGRVEALVKRARGVDRVVHLAAQAGVRYSLDHPRAYVASNLVAQLEVMEACRGLKGLKHFVYASSSSVYGGNAKLPFAEDDRVETPQSLYAATKRADELMAYCYAHLYRIPTTGLRFFTVYGPWGRPDMAAWLFVEAIEKGEPIKLFNDGRMRRDFSYIDDIVPGVLAALDRPPPDGGPGAPPCCLYNLGNNRAEDLGRFVAVLESALGKTAKRRNLPMQPGDVPATYADIAAARRDLGFAPRTTIDDGLRRFVDWYRDYHKRR